jgi:hypothetical protein
LAAETGAALRELMNRMGHRAREIAVGPDRIVAEARNQAEGHAAARTTTAVVPMIGSDGC